MPFLCRSTKKWRKKGNQRLPPLESVGARVNDAARHGRSAHVCAKGERFRFCVCLWKSKGKQIGQRFLLFRFARNLCWQGCVAGSKKICFRLLRATSVFAFGLPKANASVEFAYLRKNIGGAVRRQFLRAPRVPRGNPLAPFFRHFLGRAKKWHQKTAQRTREAVCASGYAESKKLLLPLLQKQKLSAIIYNEILCTVTKPSRKNKAKDQNPCLTPMRE